MNKAQALSMLVLVLLLTEETIQIKLKVRRAVSDSNRRYQCGERKRPVQDLITHGTNTKLGEWPWHGGLFYRLSRRSREYMCGATLIHQNFVITASHCVVDRESGQEINAKLVSVDFGYVKLFTPSTFSQTLPVYEIIVHPEFTAESYKHDVALLSLKRTVEFSDYVLPICLEFTRAETNIHDIVGLQGVVVGWGLTEHDENSSDLKVAHVPVVDYAECLDTDRDLFGSLIYPGMFCAGLRNGTSVCNGDSGGGVYFSKGSRWYLRGITSSSGTRDDGSNKCNVRNYAGFVNVQYYVSWIRKKVYEEDDLSTEVTTERESVTCTTPTLQPGMCVAIERCRNIHGIVNNPTPQSVGIDTYIKRAACTLPNVSRSICCQPAEVVLEPTTISPPVTESSWTHPKLGLLPRDCGRTVQERKRKRSLDQTLIDWKLTQVFEYPWMAVLRYDYNGTIIDGCSGTLINKRYILTAAHCVDTRTLPLHSVVLGEHTKNLDQDCNIYNDWFAKKNDVDCADPIEVFGIEKFIKHPDYNRPKYSNDIGLVRLNRDVVMKDHIRPICLPVTSALQMATFNRYIVTGWRTKTEETVGSLLQARVPPVSIAECQQKIKEKRPHMQLSDRQLCTGGRDWMGACMGETGGPLGTSAPYNDGIRFMQFGIFSSNDGHCGEPSLLGIYCQVSAYMNWILDNMNS